MKIEVEEMRHKLGFILVALISGGIVAMHFFQQKEISFADAEEEPVILKEIHKPEWGLGDLAKHYKNVAELYRDSVLVVIGTAEEDTWAIDTKHPAVDYGAVRVKVEKVLKGKCGDEILVVSTAYIKPQENRIVLFGRDPWKKGKRYIFFLSEAINPELDSFREKWGMIYIPTGAYQGEFRVVNNRVYSRNVIGEAEPEGLKVRGMPLSEFIKEMKKR
jgi:hypothetical protein